MNPSERKVKPEDAVRILKEYGEDMTLHEAELMLDLMYDLAEIALRQALNNTESFTIE